MKIKVVMDSGKEYLTESYSSVEKLLDSAVDNSLNVVFLPLDSDKSVWINGNSISSVEEIN